MALPATFHACPVQLLGTPVVPFCPFYLGVSLLKLNSRKKGTLIINGLLWINVRDPLYFLGYGIPYTYLKRILFSS